jgi:peptidoglycan hydrolase-like protein with peptidoglycan-binding domain
MNAFGAIRSKYDKRTLIHDTTVVKALPLTTGGMIYPPEDIENQRKVGICTAIDITNQASKFYGKKYSADFQYLIQKSLVDGNWIEGSSVFSALKTANKYGFLPAELFPITEKDRIDTYANYLNKLQNLSGQISYLLTKCENKLAGYAQLPYKDPQSIATAINDNPTGIQCMVLVGKEWYTDEQGIVTYAPALIDPIRPPKIVISGHSIKATYFDFTANQWPLYANTWGTDYDLGGNCHIGYTPIEAWIPYFTAVPPTSVPFKFTKDLYFGMTNHDVGHLQARLGLPLKYQTNYFGTITLAAVIAYQVAHGIFPQVGYCGSKTRSSLNSS